MLPRYLLFLLIKDKENFPNKENCFVADPAGDLVFMPNFILFFLFLTTEFNTTIFFLFQKGKHIQNSTENYVKHPDV